jgi:hypothetical protein
MGNRFSTVVEYHKIVKAHGILAAITFMFIVPAAIFIARFYWRDPRLAMRMHIWLQILTVFLSTVILTLGWFAVGPQRSLSNPHHGIGVAIYVMIMFQVIWGWLVRRMERGRTVWRTSIKLMVCHLDHYYATMLTTVVSPMAGQGNCSARIGTDSPWPYPLWLSQGSIHSLCPLDVRPGCGLLYFHPPIPVRWR